MGSDEAFDWRDVDRDLAVLIERKAAQLAKVTTAVALDNLGRQLTIAAGLCRAFWLGAHRQRYIHARLQGHAYCLGDDWHPGCRREAP